MPSILALIPRITRDLGSGILLEKL